MDADRLFAEKAEYQPLFDGWMKKVEDELTKLGKHKVGGGCLYIKSLVDVNAAVLKRIFAKTFKEALSKKKDHTD